MAARRTCAHRVDGAEVNWSMRVAAMALALLALAASVARADSPTFGNGPAALPAVERVGLAGAGERGFGAVAGVGYGFTESVLGESEDHHRLPGRLALSFSPIDWFALALRADGRLDLQSGGANAGDARFLGESQALVRGQGLVVPDLGLGVELALRFPGAASPGDGLAATTPELHALATGAVGAALAVSGLVGFRLDRTDEAVGRASLTAADRLALGAGEVNALLLGLALYHRRGRAHWFGEWSWDVLVGSRAPGTVESPMRIEGGLRYFLTDSFHLEGLLGMSPSARPSLASSAPLVPVEPRVWGSFAVGLALPFTKPAARAPAPPSPALPAPAPPPLATGAMQGRVLDEAGSPIAGAEIIVATGEPPARATSDLDGRYALAGLPPGTYELTVRAAKRPERVQRVEVRAGPALALDLALGAPLPEGQIRGTVRSFGGTALAAHVRIEPGGTEIQADAAGRFEVDVPPGDYTVRVSAPGHGEQERPAHVEENGVTVIIVDLGKER